MATSESGQKSILEKKFTLQTPIIFAGFGGTTGIKFFSKTKNGQVMNEKSLFLAITIEPLDQKFLKSGI